MRVVANLAFSLLVAAASAQAQRVEPPHWWAGFQERRLQLMVEAEGIAAAKEVRKQQPGTGVVILSQFDDPEYAIALLDEGSAGYGYLLKDRVGDGNRLVDAVREVATGGSVLDPEIVDALARLRRRAAG